MKPLLLLILSCLGFFPAHSAIREKRNAPVLHSVLDGKPRSFYMDDNERPFLPAPLPPHLRSEHRRIVAGRVLTIAGGGAVLLGTGLLITANDNANNGIVDDVFNGITRGFGTVLLIVGAAALIIGLIMLTSDAEESLQE
jgi:hypothetical protein